MAEPSSRVGSGSRRQAEFASEFVETAASLEVSVSPSLSLLHHLNTIYLSLTCFYFSIFLLRFLIHL